MRCPYRIKQKGHKGHNLSWDGGGGQGSREAGLGYELLEPPRFKIVLYIKV